MMPVSAQTMRELDRLAASSGVSVLSLMEKAGEAIAKKAALLLGQLKSRKVAVFCGKGNNGGDGFVASRKLAEKGFLVDVYLLGKQENVKNEAGVNLSLFVQKWGRVKEINSPEEISSLKAKLDSSLIIDSMLGTGFSGHVSDPLKNLIELLNSTGTPILAVDVPSGLNSTTGKVDPVAIKAKWTISFGLSKKGFYKESGPEHTGKIEIVNIGFKKDLLKKAIEFEENHF